MNTAPDATTADDNGGNFDPQHAAALLGQTTLQARRKFEPSPPWLLVIRALIALAAYGAVWLSVRGQHPYKYPTAEIIPVVIVLALINLGATLTVARRATTGVTGRSRLRPVLIAAMLAAWIAVFAVMAVLAVAGVSNGIVYGLYPVSVPLIVAGLAWAGVMARRANWRGCATGLAVAVAGIGAAFAGPAGSWAVAGVSLCAVLLAAAAVIAWQQRLA
jgi:hypothetical protein